MAAKEVPNATTRLSLQNCSLASKIVLAHEELAAAADASVRTVRRLVDAAQATALDVSQIRLEAGSP